MLRRKRAVAEIEIAKAERVLRYFKARLNRVQSDPKATDVQKESAIFVYELQLLEVELQHAKAIAPLI